MSERNYTVQTRINRPAPEIFEAIVSEELIGRYFVDGTSGPLREGQRIIWHWNQWGDYPVEVRKIVTNERIHLRLDSTEWKKTSAGGYPVDIFLELAPLEDGATMLSISESGWQTDAAGLQGSHENCSGWTHMALCLKAFVEHGIDLRD